MKLSQFNFRLPAEKIAQHPTEYRDESRLMVLHKKTGKIEHKMFKDILQYFDDKEGGRSVVKTDRIALPFVKWIDRQAVEEEKAASEE